MVLQKLRSRWRHEWSWSARAIAFRQRHYRRLLRLSVVLMLFSVTWSALFVGLVSLLGAWPLIWQPAFLQNVLASLLVLPIGLAIGVVVATLLQKHSLRFQARHGGDALSDAVRLAVFKFVVFLSREGRISIDLAGPVDASLVERARQNAHDAFAGAAWRPDLPGDFGKRLDDLVAELDASFTRFADLRLAFPESFDMMERVRSLHSEYKAGHTQPAADQIGLIILSHSAEIIRGLA